MFSNSLTGTRLIYDDYAYQHLISLRQVLTATETTRLENAVPFWLPPFTPANTTNVSFPPPPSPNFIKPMLLAHVLLPCTQHRAEKEIGTTYNYQHAKQNKASQRKTPPQRNECEKHKKGKTSKTPRNSTPRSISPHKKMKGACKKKENETQPRANPGSLNSPCQCNYCNPHNNSQTSTTSMTLDSSHFYQCRISTTKNKERKAPQTTNSKQHNPHIASLTRVFFSQDRT
uniref:Uncharacterized protein n=1 Tax=Timema genevievae TaxID=629358 RepID=A0A7R9JSV4_TIMGE|nr:unnamed protein product [Timema genevievae]